jgi:DNA repair exonuclease SbcCD ATPase subunit
MDLLNALFNLASAALGALGAIFVNNRNQRLEARKITIEENKQDDDEQRGLLADYKSVIQTYRVTQEDLTAGLKKVQVRQTDLEDIINKQASQIKFLEAELKTSASKIGEVAAACEQEIIKVRNFARAEIKQFVEDALAIFREGVEVEARVANLRANVESRLEAFNPTSGGPTPATLILP